MSHPPTYCPACGAGPLLLVARNRVRCPDGCETDGLGWRYLADLSPRRPVVSEDLGRLDLGQLVAPAYLGLVVYPGDAPVLCCVAQTAGQVLEEMRAAGWDFRQAEPVAIALWSCKAWEEERAA